MSQEKQKSIIMKYSDSSISIPLVHGKNIIYSDIIPELSNKETILFNLNIFDENLSLRSYNHFPLKLTFQDKDKDDLVEVTLMKQGIIKLKHLEDLKILPLKLKKYFFFEFCYIDPPAIEEAPVSIESIQNNNIEIGVNENNEKSENNFFENRRENLDSLNDLDNFVTQVPASSLNNNFEIEIGIGDQRSNDLENKLIRKINQDLVITQEVELIYFDKKLNSERDTKLNNKENNIQQPINNIIPSSKPSTKILIDMGDDDYSHLIKKDNATPQTPPSEKNYIIPRKTLIINDDETPRKNPENKENETTNNKTKNNKNEKLLGIKRNRSEAFITKPEQDNTIIINKNILTQKCSICLDKMQEKSKLDICEHEFCKECIESWAQVSNTCPLCKEEFKKIIYWQDSKQQIKKVKKRKFKYDEEEEEPWYQNCADSCMVCSTNTDSHLLLVCDKCMYNICHTYCAGLDFIPDEDWLCSVCAGVSTRRRTALNFNSVKSSQEINNISLSLKKSNSKISNVSRSSVKLNKAEKEKVLVKKQKDDKNIGIMTRKGSTRIKKQVSVKKRAMRNLGIELDVKETNNKSEKKMKRKAKMKYSLRSKAK